MQNPIFLNFNQIIERFDSQGIEYDKKQMQSIFSIFDTEDESGTKGVKDKKLTNSELSNFLNYIKTNYVDKFINIFSDISENMAMKQNSERQEISMDNEFYSPKREVQLFNYSMSEFEKLSAEQKNRVKELLYIEGRGKEQFNDEDLLMIGQLSQEEFEKIKEFLAVPGRNRQYSVEEMLILSNIPKEKHHLFNNPARGDDQISPTILRGKENDGQYIQFIEQLSLVKVNMKDLFRKHSGERFLSDIEISTILENFAEDGLERAVKIIQDPVFSDCTIVNIQPIIKLSDEQIEEIKNIIQNSQSGNSILIDGIANLNELTSEELEIAKKYYNIPERGKQQLSGAGIALIVKLSDEERKFAEDYGLIYSSSRKRQLSGSVIYDIAKMKSDDLQDFISRNPDFQFKPATNNNSITLIDNNGVEHTFDKDGLISIRELINEESLLDGRISNTYRITNYRLHTEQETRYVALDKTEPEIYSSQTKFFDENNNLIKTLTLKENNNSSYDASISYPNGETQPLQYSSYNEETGVGTIERHFVSPQGVQTDYYYEDSEDGIRIVDYTITDANGEILLNERNTFQQLSENEFISSSNNKTYKIEFKDDNIIITDQTTQEQHSINIDKLVANPEQKNIVINYLKNIPASQLMFLEKQPILMSFDNTFDSADNGFYSYEEKELALSHPFLDNNVNQFTLSHEWGHYIDLYLNSESGTISSDETLNNIYQEELAIFLESTNADEQASMSYLMQNGVKGSERTADANALRHTAKGHNFGIRDFYYQQYFPRTIARIIELIQAEEHRVAAQ